MIKLSHILTAAFATLLSLTACGQSTQKSSETMESNSNKKVLITYFSATGTTRAVAQRLADAAGADIFEIAPETPYTDADLDWRDKTSRSTIEMKDPASRPTLANTCPDIDKYDIIYIGFPVWWYVAPHIINSFVEAHNLNGKTLVPFATSGGSGIAGCVDALRETYPDLNWRDGKLLNNPSDRDIKQFVNENK